MSIRLLDRLTGKPGAAGPGPVLLGRFVLAPQSTEVRVNGLAASDYDPLVPPPHGGWRVEARGGVDALAGSFVEEGMPSETWRAELDMVIDDRHLDRFAADEDVVLLAVEETEPPERKEQRDRLTDRLPNLERVLCMPESAIGEERVVLSASRARRSAPEAVRYLARHSEDWNRVAFGRPVPSRLLAIETFDDLDIYENRLALHARDEIERRLHQRRNEAAAQANLLDKVAKRLGDQDLNWRPRERLARLLGSQESLAAAAVQAQGRSHELSREAQELDRLQAQVRQLDSAVLSTAMRSPDKRRVSDFHLVNRLAVHADYREVGILFSEWVAGRMVAVSSSDDADAGWRRTIRQYDTFVAMLVCHALGRLGLDPPRGARLERGGPPLAFQATRPPDATSSRPTAADSRATMPAVTLEWTRDGALELDRMLIESDLGGVPSVPDEPIVRIVALIDGSLPVDGPDDLAPEYLRRELGDAASAQLFIVTPSGEDRDAELTALPERGPFVLTASPRAVDGAEGVMRLLRKLLWEPAFAGYPHPVNDIDRPVAEELMARCPDWLRRLTANEERSPTERVAIHGRMPMAAADLSSMVRQAVKDAHPAFREREQAQRADEVVRALLRARAWHGWGAVCPLCGGAPEHEDRTSFGEDFFRHRCATCRCLWEVLVCGCGQHTGIIEPRDRRPRDMSAGDRSYLGPDGDLLARPVIRTSGHQWLCERCFVSAVGSVGA